MQTVPIGSLHPVAGHPSNSRWIGIFGVRLPGWMAGVCYRPIDSAAGQQIDNHLAMNIGQTAFNAIVVKTEAFVIQSQQVKNGRVNIVNRDRVFHGLESEVVGGAMGIGFFDSSAGQPDRESFGVMVPTAGALLKGWHPAKLGAPHNQRVIQQAALLEILEQRGSRLIENRPVNRVLFLQLFVAVPVAGPFAAGLIGAVEQLDKPYAIFNQPPGQDTIPGKSRFHLVPSIIGAVHAQGIGGFG